jgi:hypothetical protein
MPKKTWVIYSRDVDIVNNDESRAIPFLVLELLRLNPEIIKHLLNFIARLFICVGWHATQSMVDHPPGDFLTLMLAYIPIL